LGQREVPMKEVEAKLLKYFAEVFEAKII
jgi:hypothetical protein